MHQNTIILFALQQLIVGVPLLVVVEVRTLPRTVSGIVFPVHNFTLDVRWPRISIFAKKFTACLLYFTGIIRN